MTTDRSSLVRQNRTRDDPVDDLVQLLLGPAGTLVLALAILLGGWKGFWVFGWQFRDVKREKDEWKAMALRGTDLVEKVVELQAKNGP